MTEKTKNILINLSAKIKRLELKLKYSFCRREVVNLMNEIVRLKQYQNYVFTFGK